MKSKKIKIIESNNLTKLEKKVNGFCEGKVIESIKLFPSIVDSSKILIVYSD